MALKIPRCPRCSAATELKTVASVSAKEGPLKLTFTGLPVFECPKQHRVPVHGDFMLWVIREIRLREAELDAGKEEGMLVFKKHLCGACGKPLAAKSEREQAFSSELKHEDLSPFRLEIGMPVYKCSACGKEQIRSTRELHGLVPNAMVGINDAVGFPHSG